MAVRVVKDATPLLDGHLAFPFKLDKPGFRYEGALSILTPITDFFAGAYSDNLPLHLYLSPFRKKSGDRTATATVLMTAERDMIATVRGAPMGATMAVH